MPRLARLRRLAARRLPVATKDQVRAVEATTLTWRKAYERLLAAADNRTVGKPPRKVPSPDPAVRVRAKAEKRASSSLLTSLQHGAPLTETAVTTVRDMLAARRVADARALAASLADHDGSRALGSLLLGIVASHERRHALAVSAFDAAQRPDVLRYASLDYAHSLFLVDTPRGLSEAAGLAHEDVELPAATWFKLLEYAFVADDMALSAQLADRLQAAFDADPAAWPTGRNKIPWVRRWIGATHNRTAPAPEAGRVPFAIMDYNQPDRSWASQNIGDYIQTLASVGHVVRHQNLRFHGEQADVLELVNELQGRVRPELRLDSVSADVELYTLDRDASTYQEFPEGTWALGFGWFMHPLFNHDGAFDFPFHKNLRPIIVSFHCNKRSLVTPEVVEYLRAHGPIGCRDWTTVDLLLSLDVPAFFSGCLTTTVNTVFPDLEKPAPQGTVYVDSVRSPVPPGHENIPQKIPAIKSRTFTRNMRDAIDLLEGYRTGYTDVVTLRLHCYLPATSLGMKVTFEPKNNADVRFSGLFRLSAEEFEAIRTPMRDRLQPVLEAIFSGRSEDEVYALWRQITEPDVRLARERHARPAVHDERGARVARAARALAPARPSTDAVDVVLTPTAANLPHLAPVLRSAAASSARPVRAWVVAPLDGARPAVDVDGVELHWVDTSGIATEGLDLDTVTKVALAELVPVDRAVLLPVDAYVAGDLARLLETDLDGHVLAARSTTRAVVSGFGVLYGAGRRMDATPQLAYEYYREIHARHVFDFDAFDPELAVLDLDAMRERGLAAATLGAVATYGLDEREGLHWFVGPQRAVLDASWGYVPTREVVDKPLVWHWADANKPWSPNYVPGQELWLASRS